MLKPVVDCCKFCKHEWIRRRKQAAKVCSKCKRTDWKAK